MKRLQDRSRRAGSASATGYRRSFAERLREAALAHHELSPSHYQRLPSPAQDVLCSAYGLVHALRLAVPRAGLKRSQIDALHRDVSASGLLVEQRMRSILELARSLPGYAGSPPRAATGTALDELAKWPPLTKDQLRNHGEDFLTRDPGGSDISAVTSGTTGAPVRVWRTLSSYQEIEFSRNVIESWFLGSARTRRAAFTYRLVVPLESRRVWRLSLPERNVVLSSFHISAEHIGSFERLLSRWRPHILNGAASELAELAAVLKDRRILPHVPLVVSSSEMLPLSSRSIIRSVFGGQITDVYGTSEEIALAGECPAGSRHVFPNVGVIEAVDDEGRRVPEGEPGRLLLTTLTNDLMPLIRFDVGDVGTIEGPGSCPCGRTSPVLRDLHGREDDVIFTPDGRRISIFAFNLALQRTDVVALQLVQERPDAFLVRVRLTQDDLSHRASFEATVKSDFERLLGSRPQRTVTFSYTDVIERTSRGKVRNVIRTF